MASDLVIHPEAYRRARMLHLAQGIARRDGRVLYALRVVKAQEIAARAEVGEAHDVSWLREQDTPVFRPTDAAVAEELEAELRELVMSGRSSPEAVNRLTPRGR